MAAVFEGRQNHVNVRKPHANHAFTSVLRGANTPLAAAGHAATVRRALLLSVLVALASLVVAASASARARVVDRGVVLRVRPFAILIQELDGSRARIRVSPRTVVVLDGRPATLSALRRGEVVWVIHVGRRPALRIRAFSR